MRGPSEIRTDVLPPQQRLPLVLGEAAFRPDQHRAAGLVARAATSAATGSFTSASSSQNTSNRSLVRAIAAANETGSATSGSVKMPHCCAASIDIGAHALEIDACHLRVPGEHRLQPRDAHLHRLLHQIIEPGVLERGKQKMQIGRARLLARAFADRRRKLPVCRRADEPGPPFAVAAIEQEHLVAVLKPQHVTQIIRLGAIEDDVLAALASGAAR